MEIPAGRLSGPLLRAIVTAVRKTPARHVVARVLRSQLGIDELRALPPELREPLPTSVTPLRAREHHRRESESLAIGRPEDALPSATRLSEAYASGQCTPEHVTRQALAGARRLATERLGPILDYDDARALEAARAAGARLEDGRPRGPLDGVVVAIKEEVKVRHLPCRVGTKVLGNMASDTDSTVVARLRDAGAIIIGTTPMTEFGMSPLGGNVQRDMPRNPHDPGRLPGGSSSGSGVAVATGVVPLALGLDGGGSVRIPACYCGVFGLKPTFGRIPATGHGLSGGSSVVHLGPLGRCVEDLALFVEATAGFDRGDPGSEQPVLEPGELRSALARGVRGLRIGVPDAEWADADRDVATPARQALDALVRDGAVLVPVQLPLARHAAAMGYLTIGLETLATLMVERTRHMDELGLDLQMLIANMETFPSDDYLDAQRLRGALRRQTAAALRDVDLIALPTTAVGAPAITNAEATSGFVDPPALAGACRFAFLGNLTGCPAGTAPIGRDQNGIPVGLQLMGDAWDEACVLQALAGLERSGVARALEPPTVVQLLG